MIRTNYAAFFFSSSSHRLTRLVAQQVSAILEAFSLGCGNLSLLADRHGHQLVCLMLACLMLACLMLTEPLPRHRLHHLLPPDKALGDQIFAQTFP